MTPGRGGGGGGGRGGGGGGAKGGSSGGSKGGSSSSGSSGSKGGSSSSGSKSGSSPPPYTPRGAPPPYSPNASGRSRGALSNTPYLPYPYYYPPVFYSGPHYYGSRNSTNGTSTNNEGMSVGSKIALGLIFGLIGLVLLMVAIVKVVDHYINKSRKSTIEENNNVWNEQVNHDQPEHSQKGQFSAVPHVNTSNPYSSNMA